MGNLHFDDVIKVDRVDVDGKKYDKEQEAGLHVLVKCGVNLNGYDRSLFIFYKAIKVSRIEARCEELDMNLQLDVNTELYPIRVGDRFRTVLANTLNEDGSAVTSYFPEGKKKSLADKFEYVMHGLLYKISEDKSGPNLEAVVYISFGGLQLALKGDATKLGKFKVDQKLFLLMRKV